MTTTTYHFRDNGKAMIPVADGDFYLDEMTDGHSFGECYVAFYDESGELVTPSAGTVTFSISAVPGQYLEPSDAAVLDATTCGPDATYTPPSFNSAVAATLMTLSGVEGAAYVKAIHWRAS